MRLPLPEVTVSNRNIQSGHRLFRTYYQEHSERTGQELCMSHGVTLTLFCKKSILPKAKEQIASAFASKLGRMVWTAFFTCVNWNFWDYFQGETDVSQRGRESSSCINGLLLSLSQLLFSWDFWLLYLQPATTGWRCRAGLSLCEFAYSNECVWWFHPGLDTRTCRERARERARACPKSTRVYR